MLVSVILQALGYMLDLFYFLIIVRCILSWIPTFRNPLTELVYRLTEPILAPIRNMLRKSPLGGPGMMIDFSPIIAFFLLNGVYVLLIQLFS